MSSFCRSDGVLRFTDLPLLSVLVEWMKQNLHVSHNTTTFLTNLALIMLTWYAVKFSLKILFTFTYPVMLVLCGYMAIQMLSMMGSELPETIRSYLGEIFHLVTLVGFRILGYFCRAIDPGALLYPMPY